MLIEASRILYNIEEDNTTANKVFERDNPEFFAIIGQKAAGARILNIGFRRSYTLIRKVEAVGN